MSIQILGPFSNWLFVCFWVVNILCILDRSALSDTRFANIFSHYVHVFSLSWRCLLNHRSCKFMSILPNFFFLHYLWFWDVSRNHCLTPNDDFFFLFFPKKFYRFRFYTLVFDQFQVSICELVWCEVGVQINLSESKYCINNIYWENFLPYWIFLAFFLRISWLKMYEFIFGPSIIFIYLHICSYGSVSLFWLV